MGNDYFNIRFGAYHLHIMRDKPWVVWAKNSYWVENTPEPWFKVYCAFGIYFR